ncbi:MAG TPA: oxygenase MpaB family protein [Steroidobacteraceae bacterium]|nr:oxygenase MpaB family protein [Steroidobacteraceae bacterium]
MILRLPASLLQRFEALYRDLSDPGGDRRIDFSRPRGEPALLPPRSVSWRVFKNPITVFIGGVTAVILELAEPAVRTGVWEHSRFREDPVGRLRHTGAAAMITVYGARSVAEPMIETVAHMHARVSGVTPCGIRFSATDPGLLTWVHATASYGFAAAYGEYARALGKPELDAFFEEGVATARLYGADRPPRSQQELQELLASMKARLQGSTIVFEFLDILRDAPILPRPLLGVQRMLVRAAVDLVPTWVRVRLGLDPSHGLGPLEKRMVQMLAALIDRIVLPASPPAQSCLRLGLPATYLYG